jgi:hypothetical protein
MLCILYSLYTWHNTLRHRPLIRFSSRGLWRVADEMAHRLRLKDHWITFRTLGPPPIPPPSPESFNCRHFQWTCHAHTYYITPIYILSPPV